MPGPLPGLLEPLFWEYDFAALSWERDQETVIGRVLSRGSGDAVDWLRETAGDETIRQFILRTEGRLLSPQQLRYWQTVLYLPERTVSGWLRDPRRRVWDQRQRG